MNSQNALKRTIISFSIALLTAVMAFSIQESQKRKSQHFDVQLEASVPTIGNQLLIKK